MLVDEANYISPFPPPKEGGRGIADPGEKKKNDTLPAVAYFTGTSRGIFLGNLLKPNINSKKE